MDIQRVRNLTTGILHTKMEHLYEDIEFITKSPGIMTHHLGPASQALDPYLRAQLPDPRFWNGEFDLMHTGDVEIVQLNEKQLEEFFTQFAKYITEFWQKMPRS